MNQITIDPITRLEGHGKIQIFLDDEGEVLDSFFQVPELRGFEVFCQGRPVEDMPTLTGRICGVCPEAHMTASAKAGDAVYGVELPPTAKKLRELLYSAFFCGDHTTHFYALGGPDFIVGPDAPKEQRNILGVVAKVGKEIGIRVVKARHLMHEAVSILGGKTIHPCCAIPGGMSKGLNGDEQKRMIEIADFYIEFALFSLNIFEKVVLNNSQYLDLIKGDTYYQRTYYMGTVDDKNRVNFYDGQLRVVDPLGQEVHKFYARDYLQYIEEHVESWSYLKFPVLKSIGWKGLTDGVESGIYTSTPLGRLNTADGMATPLAQIEYEKMFKTFGVKPVHHVLATHWARLVELLYSAERMKELAIDKDITGKEYRIIPSQTPVEGVGQVEAPRGVLIHHYKTDPRGKITFVNLIVGSTNNNGSISLAIKNAAKKLIGKGKDLNEGILNMVEMAFRAYDPCLACATHTLPGEMPMKIELIEKSTGRIIGVLTR